MTRDLTEAEVRALEARNAPSWAGRALVVRNRLLDAMSRGSLEPGLCEEAERLAGELRKSAVGAPPDMVAQIGRVRGAVMAYVVELRRMMLFE